MTNDELLNIINEAVQNSATSLDISSSDLSEIPSEIGQITTLKVLNLSYKPLDETRRALSE